MLKICPFNKLRENDTTGKKQAYIRQYKHYLIPLGKSKKIIYNNIGVQEIIDNRSFSKTNKYP